MVCNSGDYEDEDMIVFCGLCNLPVHQSCYGIEQLPEEDWICYNCMTFGLKRGILISCAMCPKKGGAMKPTNIYSPNHFNLMIKPRESNDTISIMPITKKGLHIKKQASKASLEQDEIL